MPEQNIPYADPGVAAFEELDSYATKFLISGSFPPLSPGFPLKVAADQELKQFHVCGYDAAGALVPATWGTDGTDGVKAAVVVTTAVKGASDGSTTVPAFYSGCFNPDALVWDDSFDTAEKKAAAFNGAPSPTQILVRARG